MANNNDELKTVTPEWRLVLFGKSIRLPKWAVVAGVYMGLEGELVYRSQSRGDKEEGKEV